MTNENSKPKASGANATATTHRIGLASRAEREEAQVLPPGSNNGSTVALVKDARLNGVLSHDEEPCPTCNGMTLIDTIRGNEACPNPACDEGVYRPSPAGYA